MRGQSRLLGIMLTSPKELRKLNEEEAIALAEKVLALDNSIMSVGVISNVGVPLGGAVRESYNNKFTTSKEAWSAHAFRAATIMGSIKADDRKYSPIESVILIRKESKSVLVWVPDMAIIVVATFQRSMSGSKMSDKVREMFGLE